MTTRDALLERLMAHLAPPNDRGCRLWLLSTKNGYGQMSVDGEMVYTHRLTYELLVGPIPPEKPEVLHRCDVKRCNTLEHFFLGTQLDNLEDMRQKGRGVAPPILTGESHPLVTLADVDVATIRRRYLQGRGQRALAREYGCSQSTIHRYVFDIVRRNAAAYPDPHGIWMPPRQLSLIDGAA